MRQSLVNITLVVRDYDEAIKFYMDRLDFELVEDTQLSENKRWVRLQPKGGQCCLLLGKAVGEEQEKAIGNQTGGRVFLFLHTDDFERDFKNYVERGVEVVREPSHEAYGTVAVIADLYGNKIDLIQPKL